LRWVRRSFGRASPTGSRKVAGQSAHANRPQLWYNVGTNQGHTMTYDELYRAILEVLPAAQLGEDNDGQIVVYTDMMIDIYDGTDNVVPFVDTEAE